jgi:hypothetical protein
VQRPTALRVAAAPAAGADDHEGHDADGDGGDAPAVGLALFTTLFRSQKHHFMTASMVHVTTLTPPGSDKPCGQNTT